jgi:protein SCO1/2
MLDGGGGTVKRALPYLFAVLLGVVVALAIVVPRLRPHEFVGTVLDDPEPAPALTLTAAGGEQVSLDDFTGKAVLLYFGYTSCPDVCPTTLAALADALDELGSRRDEVQVVMVTVDPARDTPELLASYVAHFDPSFIGLGGTAEEIATAASAYGIYYQKGEGTVETGYEVDHTAQVMLIDPQGRYREVLPFGLDGAAIAGDVAEYL